MLSSADFIAVQLFAVVALYLTHTSRQMGISALMLPSTSSQTRDLWLVTAVYELSATVSVIFDAGMTLSKKFCTLVEKIKGSKKISKFLAIFQMAVSLLKMVVLES